MLSVVIPSYNEEAMIHRASEEIESILKENQISYELLFIDDGSSDNTWKCICDEAEHSKCIHGVKFSRNFGKEGAIMAGLKEAKGECVAVLDCDLQHPPVKMVEMYRLWEKGYEIIEGMKTDRGAESPLRSAGAGIFNSIMGKSLKRSFTNASDFKLLDRKVVNIIINLPERNIFFRALSSWVGFKTTTVEYDVEKRESGETKWSFGKLVGYAISNITSFTTLPMQLVLWFGVIIFIIGLVFSVIALVQKFMGNALEGFTTVIILLCFIGSIIMLALGIIGFYIAKIYEEVLQRPRYVISEKI